MYYPTVASLISKRKKNKLYYYVVESARRDGRPRIVHQTYLGNAEKVAAFLKDRTAPCPSRPPAASWVCPETVQKATQLKPAVVILDINMPELNGLDVARQILKARPETEILILTMDESPAMMRELISSGVHGYVFKSDFGGDLIPAVKALSNHGHYLTPKGIQLMYQNLQQSPTGRKSQVPESLTGRKEKWFVSWREVKAIKRWPVPWALMLRPWRLTGQTSC